MKTSDIAKIPSKSTNFRAAYPQLYLYPLAKPYQTVPRAVHCIVNPLNGCRATQKQNENRRTTFNTNTARNGYILSTCVNRKRRTLPSLGSRFMHRSASSKAIKPKSKRHIKRFTLPWKTCAMNTSWASGKQTKCFKTGHCCESSPREAHALQFCNSSASNSLQTCMLNFRKAPSAECVVRPYHTTP